MDYKEREILMVEGLYPLQEERMINWTLKEIKPLLVYASKSEVNVPFFGSLLLAPLQTSSRRFLCGLYSGFDPSRKKDWREWADQLFYKGCWLSATHETVIRYNLPTVDIWLMLPYPRVVQYDFGSIGGKRLSFLNQEDRKTALQWWIRYVVNRFEKHVKGKWKSRPTAQVLRLRGLVWGRECIPVLDKELVSQCNDFIHQMGLESMWLPNYGTAHVAEGHMLGFDQISIFSNYTGNTEYGTDFLQNSFNYVLVRNLGVQVINGRGVRFDDNHVTNYLSQKRVYDEKGGCGPVVYRFPNHSLLRLYLQNDKQYDRVFASLQNRREV